MTNKEKLLSTIHNSVAKSENIMGTFEYQKDYNRVVLNTDFENQLLDEIVYEVFAELDNSYSPVTILNNYGWESALDRIQESNELIASKTELAKVLVKVLVEEYIHLILETVNTGITFYKSELQIGMAIHETLIEKC